jgi:hypothetical protein
MRFWVKAVSVRNQVDICSVIAYLAALFQEDLIIFAQCDTKYYRGNVLEAVDPLLPLAPLAADVEHTEKDVSNNFRIICFALNILNT